MAQTAKPTANAVSKYTVLRAICMQGQRVEVGATVELTQTQYTEAAAAGKVGPYVAPPAAAAKPKDAKPTKEAQP